MYKLKTASEINYALASLPKAIEKPVFTGIKNNLKETWTMRKQNHFKAIEVEGKTVAIPSNHYQLVQHEEAFRPIIEGLTLRGVEDFKFSLFANHKKAWLNIFVSEGTDSIRYGFRAQNSFDRTTSINVGIRSYFLKNRVVEIVGYRQVCSNGMVVRVNLDEAEFVREEERGEILELLKKQVKIKHNSLAEARLEELQYTVEAFLLMKNPLKRIVDKAQSIELYKDQAEEIIEKYIGKRKLDKVMEQYGREEETLWGLFNSITFIASHTKVFEKATKFNTMIDKAATMLEEEIKVSS